MGNLTLKIILFLRFFCNALNKAVSPTGKCTLSLVHVKASNRQSTNTQELQRF